MTLFYKECKVHYQNNKIYIITPTISEIDRYDWVLSDDNIIERYDGNFLSDDRRFVKKIIATNDTELKETNKFNLTIAQIPDKLISHFQKNKSTTIQIQYEDLSYLSQDLCKITIHKYKPYIRGNKFINYKL